MINIIINGKFMADGMQGIVRFAREITSALDKQMQKGDRVLLAVPPDAHDIPEYKNIKVIHCGRRTGILWEQTDLRRFKLRHKDMTIFNPCNISPFFAGSSVTIVHDIIYKVRPSYYTTLRNRISRLWHMLQYRYLFHHEKLIITDSVHSKKDIEKHYRCARGKVRVVYAAWQHIQEKKPSDDWQERFPYLKSGEFFFTLSTLSRNKNGRWIIETAKNNPSLTFAMAGKIYETEYDTLPSNVKLLGFVSDEDACALMKNCRAFIFPSLYEGFGLPPLEALAMGADVIASDTTSMPEVLGDAVRYIDPHRTDYDLEELLKKPVSDRSTALDRFSWDSSAARLYKMLSK